MGTKTDARFFDVLRALAAFCVVCAHSTQVNETGGLTYQFSQVLDYLGTMGVPIFFLISGFLFAYNKKPLTAFWKGKAKTIVLPWFFCATLVWLYVVLRKGGLSFLNWLLFVLGYGHSTYYLTVLMALYLIFWKRKQTWFLCTMASLSAISLLVTAWIVDPLFEGAYAKYYYLNVLNWMGYFAIGILINKTNALPRLKEFTSHLGVLCLALGASVLYVILCKTNGVVCTYFSKYALLGTMVNCIWVVGLASRLESGNANIVRLLTNIGKCSFTIYLLHQLFAGAVVAVTNLVPVSLIVLARPFVIMAIVMIAIWLSKILFKSERIRNLIGMRS